MCEGVELDELDEATCLRLLRSVNLGRVVFTDRALPAVQLVSYAVVADCVVFRTAPDSKVAGIARDHVVALQADQLDFAAKTGWSVVAVGVAGAITDPAEREQLKPLIPAPWAPGSRDHYIRIRLESLSGRRISRLSSERTA